MCLCVDTSGKTFFVLTNFDTTNNSIIKVAQSWCGLEHALLLPRTLSTLYFGIIFQFHLSSWNHGFTSALTVCSYQRQRSECMQSQCKDANRFFFLAGCVNNSDGAKFGLHKKLKSHHSRVPLSLNILRGKYLGNWLKTYYIVFMALEIWNDPYCTSHTYRPYCLGLRHNTSGFRLYI